MDSKKSLYLTLGLGIASTFFAFLGIIMCIVIEADAWGYIIDIINLFAPAVFLTLTLLKMGKINVNKYLYFIPLAVFALSNFFNGIHSLIEMADSRYSKSSYFYYFIESLIVIAAISFLAFTIYKFSTLKTYCAISITFLTTGTFFLLIRTLIRLLFTMGSESGAKYAFSTLFEQGSIFMVYAIYVVMLFFSNKEQSAK